MPLRLFALFALATLLSGCADRPGVSSPASQATPTPEQTSPRKPAPLPAHMRELSGRLHGAPANCTVELALLAVDGSGRPRELVAVTRLNGTGQTLPFQLRFVPRSTPPAQHLELRGRASRSGRLIMRLPAWPIAAMDSQLLGDLRLVPAP